MARVSVVIPVYNIEKHLRQCLDSVAGQTLRDLEIICVDDGSTDASQEILAEYASKDSRFQIITQSNAGPGAARNAGMALATGEYLIFLDSDDWFEADFLEHMVMKAEETGADVTICRAVEFDTDTGKELPSDWMLKSQYLPGEAFSPEEVVEHIFQFTYGWPWDKLYRREFVERSGLKYPALPNSEDLVFVFQSLAMAEQIAIQVKPLVHHRVNRMSSVSNSRHKDPEVPHQALVLLRDELEKRKVYTRYEQSFLNWAMEFLVWNVSNIYDEKVQRYCYHELQKRWLPDLNLKAYPSSYYYDRLTYAKYQLVKKAPYLIFFTILQGYKKIKQLTRSEKLKKEKGT